MKQQHLSILLLLSLIVGLAACQNEDDSLPRSFTVRGIEYAFMEGDGESTYAVEFAPEHYSNLTDTPLPIEVDSYDIGYAETCFSSSDPEAFTWSAGADTVWVKGISTKHGKPYADDRNYVPYLPETYRSAPTGHVTDSLKLPPNSQVEIKEVVYFRKLTATYVLEVEEFPSGEVHEFTGKVTKTWRDRSEAYITATEADGTTETRAITRSL